MIQKLFARLLSAPRVLNPVYFKIRPQCIYMHSEATSQHVKCNYVSKTQRNMWHTNLVTLRLTLHYLPEFIGAVQNTSRSGYWNSSFIQLFPSFNSFFLLKLIVCHGLYVNSTVLFFKVCWRRAAGCRSPISTTAQHQVDRKLVYLPKIWLPLCTFGDNTEDIFIREAAVFELLYLLRIDVSKSFPSWLSHCPITCPGETGKPSANK